MERGSDVLERERKKWGREEKNWRIAQIHLVSGHPEVCKPCDDSFALEDSAASVSYFATDINPHAVRVTSETLKAHTVHAEVLLGRDGIASAWAGGEDGRTVIDKILPVADKLLSNKGLLHMITLAANNPSQISLLMKEKGYASRIIVQRSTEEESLHVIKFWRDPDLLVGEPKDLSVATTQRTSSAGMMDSIFLQSPRKPFLEER
ncbi:hypothetical protein MKW92_035355 [Papaver armeniacum]|nr:hypothetical protein MKW92_035355 [Papaver armeniacum]